MISTWYCHQTCLTSPITLHRRLYIYLPPVAKIVKLEKFERINSEFMKIHEDLNLTEFNEFLKMDVLIEAFSVVIF